MLQICRVLQPVKGFCLSEIQGYCRVHSYIGSIQTIQKTQNGTELSGREFSVRLKAIKEIKPTLQSGASAKLD